jgi:alcohol dehydrogenase YqhD (iron-dependent ADH family)
MNPSEFANNVSESVDVILAVAHGVDKTIIYKVPEERAVQFIRDLMEHGVEMYRDIIQKNRMEDPYCATNSADNRTAQKAMQLESEADFWIDLTDIQNSCQEALEAAGIE